MNHSPRRPSWLVTATADGETVIYDPVRDALHVLNATATAVWDLLDGRQSEAEIGQLIAERSADPRATSDVRDLVETLRATGLVLPQTNEEPTEVFRALDYVFTVDGDDRELVMTARDSLRDLRSASNAVPAHYWLRSVEDTVVIEVDGAATTVPTVPERAIHMLLWHVNQAAVHRGLDRQVILHAAAVERDEAVVVLPGGMESGKTTTTAALLCAGYHYLSDELAAIEPRSLRVRPYPKPLGIDAGSQQVLADLKPSSAVDGTGWQVPATDIRPDALANAGQALVIIAPHYQRSATTQLEPLSPARMVVHLADCAFGFRDRARRDLAVLARLVETCACYRLTISTLDDAVNLVNAALRAAMRSLPHSRSARGR